MNLQFFGGRGAKSGKGRDLTKAKSTDSSYLREQRKLLEMTQKHIPSDMKYGMSEEEIYKKIITDIKTHPEKNIEGITYLDIDGRFEAPKNPRYNELIAGLNSINIAHIRSDRWQALREQVEKITSEYTTRELTKFISDELGQGSRNALYHGRQGRQAIIELVLNERLYTPNGRPLRSTLAEISDNVRKKASDIHLALTQRSIYEERIKEEEREARRK